jgi:spermidine synthase
MSSSVASNRGVNALLLLFIGSGCAALIYEVVWYQSLSLIVGSNAVSMAVVLATYMGGMSLGSLAFLRWKGRHGHPLMIYAKLELLIAACALFVLFVLPYAGGLYFAIGGSGPISVLIRGLFCAIFLLVPTMAMGATLPAASAWLRTTPQGVSRIGAYYTTNILGGVFGALFAGFYLLRVHDMQVATYVAMALNVVVALVAYVLAKADKAYVASAQSADEKRDVVQGEAEVSPRLVLFTIAMSGACALGAQVIWSRNLALLMGGTVYTFSLILGAVLLGLAIGSGMGASMVRTTRSPRFALALCQIGAMLGLAWAAWWQLKALPNWPINPSLAPSMWFNFQLDFVRALWSVLPAAICWGASFPLAIAALAQSETSSTRAVARIYAANTLGAIGGTLISSLILVQFIGTQKTQWLFMFLALLGAVVMLLPRSAPAGAAGNRIAWLAASVLLFCVSVPFVSKVPGILAGYGRWAVTWLNSGNNFIFVGEGLNATLAVSEVEGGKRYYHNAGKVQASSTIEDMRLQRMLGHITTLVSKNPENVLVIGCGAGVTAGSVSINPEVKRQTIAEIEPLVPKVVSKYFGEENHHVIDNPKVKVHLDDARHFLLTTDQKFDAITADPFDVWVKGSATLNTLEFYKEMKKHLKPGGVVTAWVAFYEVDSAAWKSELATFMQVFPHAMVFGNTSAGGGYDGVMVGSDQPLDIDVSAVEAKLQKPEFAAVRQSLIDVNYPDAVSLFGTFAADASQLEGYLRDAQINRDRNLRLQYLAGMAVNQYQQADLYAKLKAAGGWKDGLFKGDEATMNRLRATISGP